MEIMANVLESKTVEAQETEQLAQNSPQGRVEDRQVAIRLKAEEARKIQALQMTRARIREQLSRTSNERYTMLLNSELQQIESELAKRGLTSLMPPQTYTNPDFEWNWKPFLKSTK